MSKEKKLKKERRWEFPFFLIASKRALDRALSLFPNSISNGQSDAFRRAHWNAVLSRFIGTRNCKRWTDAHE